MHPSLPSKALKALLSHLKPPPFALQSILYHTRPFTQSCINFKKKKRLVFVPPLNEADLIEQFVRGSGPGGQAVNKTNNAVSLIHQPTGIRVQAHTHRSREANRNQARRVLAERVDFFVNRGQSQIEKQWKREQRRKLNKIKKRKRKEKEEELKMKNKLLTNGQSNLLIQNKNLQELNSENMIRFHPHPSSPNRNHEIDQSTLPPRKLSIPKKSIHVADS